MTSYLLGLKEIWKILMTKESQEIQENREMELLKKRIQVLEETIKVCLKMLETWEDVSRKMLYPHQHNTGTLTKQVISEVRKVLND